MRRLAVQARGVVQGVGFRPFVHAAATARGLSGWVQNRADAVHLEVQGRAADLENFLAALTCPPPAARVDRIDTHELPLGVGHGFFIIDSADDGGAEPVLPADLAVCAACCAEMDDPAQRRHDYPFTNCTQCGPRYSIALALPYDRERTSMRGFALCAACAREYDDPKDRRFHAQPIACPACGPRLRLVTPDGTRLAEGAAALEGARSALCAGEIVALQGLGGFQLLADATSADAVRRLRVRKGRDDKPLAVMFASLEAARRAVQLSPEEAAALASPAAPILLVPRLTAQAAAGKKAGEAPAQEFAGDVAKEVTEEVAPRLRRLGVLLPYTPLHRLLLATLATPLVCTSGNLSDEPMCLDESEARARLGRIADVFLTHDRPIVRPLDDSVARVEGGELQLLRRARGFTPLPLALPALGARCVLATGSQLKSTVALGKAGRVVLSQHLGDLFSARGVRLLERTAEDLLRFSRAEPEVVACDLHPDYASTRLAERLSEKWRVPLERVQHHHAHIAACMAEHGLEGPVLGLAWDGAGLGTDGTLWGGEALIVEGGGFRRFAHLRPFSLPGGDSAAREPARSGLGLLHAVFGAGAARHAPLEPARAHALLALLDSDVCCARTTSLGRLFDAVAALSGVRTERGYEGQAALELEQAAEGVTDAQPYVMGLREPKPSGDVTAPPERGDVTAPPGGGESAAAAPAPLIIDWEPLLHALLDDRSRGVTAGVVSARFHAALVALAEEIARRAGLLRVVLGGGCFQNARLLSALRARLGASGFSVYTPRLYPPNDGGLSLGQLYVAAIRHGRLGDGSHGRLGAATTRGNG